MHNIVQPHDTTLAAHQIEPLIHHAISLLQPRLVEHTLDVDYQASDDVPKVVIDRVLFEQAFVAVLTNAIAASPDDRHIGLVLGTTVNGVTIRIQDEGPGLTE